MYKFQRELERESRALEQAAQLCRDMRADGVDFCTLDARRYLDRLAREEEVLAKDQDPVRIFPWRRCWARELDLAIYGAVLVLVLQVCFKMNYLRISGGPGANMLLALACLLVMAGAETVMLHLWGTTPGKALLGLKILREDGTPLSLPESARRAGMVPAPFFLPKGLIAVAAVQVYLVVRLPEKGLPMVGLPHGPGHGRHAHQGEQRDPAGGQKVKYAGKGRHHHRLTVDGTFEEVPREDNAFVIYAFGEPPVPQAVFHFTEEKGVLTQVALTRSYESEGPVSEGLGTSSKVPSTVSR